MQTRGRIIEVVTEYDSTNVIEDYVIGNTVLHVPSVALFDETGATLNIGGNIYPYTTSQDIDYDIITLGSGLLDDIQEGTPIYTNPMREYKTATIDTLVSGDTGETREVPLSHSMQLVMPAGARDEGMGEEVIIDQIMGVDHVVQVVRFRPEVPSEYLTGLPPDGWSEVPTEAPTEAPVISVLPTGIAAVEVKWDHLDGIQLYHVHASLTSPVAEDGSDYVGSTASAIYRIYELGGVDIPMESEVFVKVNAVNIIDGGPFSNEASGITRSADDFISAVFIAALRGEFNELITGVIDAAFANVTGVLNIGPYMRFDGDTSTFTTWSDLAHTQVVAKISPFDTVFRGRMESDLLSLVAGIILTGSSSQLSAGAILTLMYGVQDPGTPATLAMAPLGASWTAQPAGFNERGICWSAADSKFYRLLVPTSGSIGGACRVQEVNSAGVAGAYITLLNIVSFGELDMNGLTKIGGYFYTVVKEDDGDWCTVKFNATTGAYVDRSNGAFLFGRPTVGQNTAGTELYVAYLDNSTGTDYLVVTPLDPGTMAGSSSLDGNGLPANKLYWDSSWSNNLSYVGIGNFDFGSEKLVVYAGQSGRHWTKTGSLYDYNSDKYFAGPASVAVGGFTWNGTIFQATYGTAVRHQFNNWQNSTGLTKGYVTYTFTAPSKETKDSPPAELIIKSRNYLMITIPSLPISEVTGRTVYVGTGTSLPADSALWKRNESIANNAMIVDLSVAPGATHPPATSTFGTGSSGKIQSQSGLSYLMGNDDAAFPNLDNILDTDWSNIAYVSGYNGTATPGQGKYRKYGRHVRLIGGVGITAGSFVATLTQITQTALPVAHRPATGERIRFVATGTSLKVAMVEVRDDGHIWVAPANAVTGLTWIALDHGWFVDKP